MTVSYKLVDGDLGNYTAFYGIVTIHGRRVLVPANKYYLLGDNRGNSYDSRFFGLVDRSAILGRAVGVFFWTGRNHLETALVTAITAP